MKFPDVVGNMECLQELYLDGTGIEELPSSVQHLTGLVLLSLSFCKTLKSLPSSINRLKSLKKLYLSGCSKLKNVPDNLREVESLEELDVSGTAIRQPPVSIFHLNNLKKFSFRGCNGEPSKSIQLNLRIRNVPNFLQYLVSPFELLARKRVNPAALMLHSLSGLCTSLTKLDLSSCNLVEGEIPSDLSRLSALSHLNLSNNNFLSLPTSISQLSALEILDLDHCKMLRSLLELPSNVHTVRMNSCFSLENVLDPVKLNNLICSGFDCLNCFKLYENGCDDSFPFTMLKGYLQGISRPRPHFEIVFPGSEIPRWFSYQSEGPSISIPKLYSLNGEKRDWMGIAACAVLSTCGVRSWSLYIRCRFKTNGKGIDTVLGYENSEEFHLVMSDHLWLFCLSSSKLAEWGIRCIDELSFESLEEEIKIKRCGARLVSRHDIEEFSRITNQWGSTCFEDTNNVHQQADSLAVDGALSKHLTICNAIDEAKSSGSTSSDEEPLPKRLKLEME